jgi:hypothetical protein
LTANETFDEKFTRNCRVQMRYDELMNEGKRGHYETMFRVVREEVERARNECMQEWADHMARMAKACKP